jgi:hypothetical protein
VEFRLLACADMLVRTPLGASIIPVFLHIVIKFDDKILCVKNPWKLHAFNLRLYFHLVCFLLYLQDQGLCEGGGWRVDQEEASMQWVESNTCQSDQMLNTEHGWNCAQCGSIYKATHKVELVCCMKGVWAKLREHKVMFWQLSGLKYCIPLILHQIWSDIARYCLIRLIIINSFS